MTLMLGKILDLRMSCFVLIVLLSSSGFAKNQKFQAYNGTHKVGSMDLDFVSGESGFEATGQFNFIKRKLFIRSRADKSWNIDKVSLRQALGPKLFTTSEIHGSIKKIIIEKMDIRGKKNRSEVGVSDLVIPRTLFYQYLAELKIRKVNEPHELQIFDEFSGELCKIQWTYLGPDMTNRKKPVHKFEVKGDLIFVVYVSESHQILDIKDMKMTVHLKNEER